MSTYYRMLVRPHPSVHAMSGTAAAIEDCWLETRSGTHGDFRVGALPDGCVGPVTRILIYASGGSYATAEAEVYVSANGTTAYRSLG